MAGSASTTRLSRPGFAPTPFLYPGTGPDVPPAGCARSKILHYGKIRPPLADGGPCRIRTCGLRIRSPTLYPTELRALRPLWRRGRDSNPRYSFGPYTGLANQRLQPLGHLSRSPATPRIREAPGPSEAAF